MKPLFYVVLINAQHGESNVVRVRADDKAIATQRVLAKVSVGYLYGTTLTEREYEIDEQGPDDSDLEQMQQEYMAQQEEFARDYGVAYPMY